MNQQARNPRMMPMAAVLAAMLSAATARGLERLEPPEGCYLGFSLGEGDTLDGLSARLGITPAVQMRFFGYPLSTSGRAELSGFLDEVRESGGIALITLEPWEGLDAVDGPACLDLAMRCAAAEGAGLTGVMIRFAHEMNGNWYPWGQRPRLFKEKFSLLARTLHSRTTRTAMLWAPNQGTGYPYGQPVPAPGSGDFTELDTNGDGILSQTDDMYEPFYPGDDVVDWVGMTLYHWGVTYPWFENEMPLPHSFARSLLGTHPGGVPDFYGRYAGGQLHSKPMAIPETAAFYSPQQPGADEFALKQAWWEQVFHLDGDTSNALDIATHFPRLKCINWFEHYKRESEAKDSWIDWRVTAEPRMRSAFVRHIRTRREGRPYFLTATDVAWQQSPHAIDVRDLPHLLPLEGSVPVSLTVKTPHSCDLVIDLLDEHFQWQGGTRVAVRAGTQTVGATFPLLRPLREGVRYRWSIFLTPTGGDERQLLARYSGPRPTGRAGFPTLRIVAFPPVIEARGHVPVRIRYVIRQASRAHLELLDPQGVWCAGDTARLEGGEGGIEFTLKLPEDLASGEYTLRCRLSNEPPGMDGAGQERVQVVSHQDSDALLATAEPSMLAPHEVLRFTAGYAARADRQLHVEVWDAKSNRLASAAKRIARGSGLADLTLVLPEAEPGRCVTRAFFTPIGSSSPDIGVPSPEGSIEVIGADYRAWADSQWGPLYSNDESNPSRDPDRDGSINHAEYTALTDPRNADDVLKLQPATTVSGFHLSWPSVTGRRYQVLRSTRLNGGVWTPMNDPVAGTGARIEIRVGTEVPEQFYRLEVLP